MATLFQRANSRIVSKAIQHGETAELTRKLFGFPVGVEKLCSAPTYNDVLKSKTLKHEVPEVIFTGRANVGKSSLINALLGRKAIAKTSGTPGRTRTLDFYGVGSLGVGLGKHRLLVVDSPGYGVRGRPSWGDTFVKYVTQRDRLKRVYVCINAGHKVSDYDISMLQQLQEHCLASSRRGGQPLTFQTVFTKSDKFPLADADKVIAAMVDQIFKAAPLCLPPAAFTSPKVVTDTTGKKMGIEELRLSIAEACGLS